MDIKTYQHLGLHQPFGEQDFFGETINGRSNAEIGNYLNTPDDRQYHPCPEAYPDDTVPKGTVTHFENWADSQIYPKTKRDIRVYVPDQFDTQNEDPPSLMIFNDGEWYFDPNGACRATKVLDTLIHAGEIPNTIAIFVMPGRPSVVPLAVDYFSDPRAVRQRSIEGDSCTPTYGKFLLEEIIPFVEGQLGYTFTKNPQRRMTVGVSTGGICAFNSAWHYPKSFGNVLSHCGSYTNIRGGHNFPYLVRTTERKSIKVFLQSGKADADIVSGNWPLANQSMASALAYAGYEVMFTFGEGGHTLRHGGALFADSVRWLWKD